MKIPIWIETNAYRVESLAAAELFLPRTQRKSEMETNSFTIDCITVGRALNMINKRADNSL